jgi:nitrogen fixation NifU-like protein
VDNKFQQLYQQVVLAHTKEPQNFYKMVDPTVIGIDDNPMCGDYYELFLRMDGDVISEVSFQGAGCAISKSSASILTTQIRGMRREEVFELMGKFYQLVRGEQSPEELEEDLGELVAFAGITAFPTRIKCVVLAWRALQVALEKING